jgi:hypothetical protein
MATATTSSIHRASVKTKAELDHIAPVVEVLGGDPEYWKSSVRYGCPICGSSDSVSVDRGDNGSPLVHCFAAQCDVWGWLKDRGAVGNGHSEWTDEDRERVRAAREQADKAAIARAKSLVRMARSGGRKPSKYLKERGINFVPHSCYLLEDWQGKTGALFPIVKFTPAGTLEVVGCHVAWLNDSLGPRAAETIVWAEGCWVLPSRQVLRHQAVDYRRRCRDDAVCRATGRWDVGSGRDSRVRFLEYPKPAAGVQRGGNRPGQR